MSQSSDTTLTVRWYSSSGSYTRCLTRSTAKDVAALDGRVADAGALGLFPTLGYGTATYLDAVGVHP